MNSLAKIEPIRGVDAIINDVENINSMCKKLMQTKYYQKMGEDVIFAICMAAKSNGICIQEALNGELYYVQGRVGMGYEAMNKYIRMAGHSVTIKHHDDKSCTLVGRRKDTGDTAEVTYDFNDAKRAGKTYDKHPKAMYFARALSMLKRFLFPDVLTKIYEKGELEDFDKMPVVDWKEEPEPKISTQQAVELAELMCLVDPQVKENALKFIFEKFKIEMIDDLPVKEFDRIKNMLEMRRDEYQKKLAEAEMLNVNAETGEIKE